MFLFFSFKFHVGPTIFVAETETKTKSSNLLPGHEERRREFDRFIKVLKVGILVYI